MRCNWMLDKLHLMHKFGMHKHKLVNYGQFDKVYILQTFSFPSRAPKIYRVNLNTFTTHSKVGKLKVNNDLYCIA